VVLGGCDAHRQPHVASFKAIATFSRPIAASSRCQLLICAGTLYRGRRPGVVRWLDENGLKVDVR